MRTTYRVTAERSGGWWALEAPEVRGAFSQVRRLDQAHDAMIDAIAGVLGADPADIDTDLQPIVPDRAERLAEVEEARHVADTAQRRASKLTRELASALAEDGFPQRDIGVLLGISHQRVQQILHH